MNVEIRSAMPDEINSYVIPTWLSSYALSFIGKLMRADSRHGVGRPAYWSEQRAKIERALSTRGVSVRVAVVEGEPVAWICDDASTRTIHYVFCNRVFRRQGLAKALMPDWYHDTSRPVYLTHMPPAWYSRPVENGPPPPWPPNVSINLLGVR